MSSLEVNQIFWRSQKRVQKYTFGPFSDRLLSFNSHCAPNQLIMAATVQRSACMSVSLYPANPASGEAALNFIFYFYPTSFGLFSNRPWRRRSSFFQRINSSDYLYHRSFTRIDAYLITMRPPLVPDNSHGLREKIVPSTTSYKLSTHL